MHPSIDLAAYETIRPLGEGGMGTVHLVRHAPSEELRVAKVVHRRWQGDPRFEARLEREARLLARLRHPHIAQLHEADLRPGGDAVLIMEFVDGLDLDGVRRRAGHLSPGLTAALAVQVAGALAHLHDQGYVHRDLSPDNIMLSWRRGPHATLIDLGIAKSLAGASAELTATGGFVGKVRYSSPEQLTAGTELDGRSDLYSFGIVLYELLTGRSPIQGDSAESLVAGHLLHPPHPFDERDASIPEALRRLVMSMLEKRPEDRPQDAAAVGRVLEEIEPPTETELSHLRDLLMAPRPEPGAGDSGDTTAFAPRRLTETLPRRRPQAPAQRPRSPRRQLVMAGALTLLASLGVILLVSFTAKSPSGDDPAPPFSAPSGRAGESTEAAENARAPTEASPPGFDGSSSPPETVNHSTLGLDPPRQIPAATPEPEEQVAAATRTDAGVRSAEGIEAAQPEGIIPGKEPADREPDVGWLILDASPWAELVDLRDAAGTALPLPEPRITPLAVSLQPGSYELTLRHPESQRPLSTRFELVRGETVRRHLDLPSLTVDDFLHDLGWP